MNEDKEYQDKCVNCPYSNTECPGGSWCTEED